LHRAELNALVAEWGRSRSSEEVLALLGPKGADLPCARVESPEALIADPQLLARGMIERQPHPVLGEVLFHGNPLRLAGAEPRARALAPELGDDNVSVYAELGLGAADLARLAEAGVI